ncbi:MAG: hypothetical protein HWN81_00240 [Candidatus Lokiarchaeota archaeon]|nr:hypothetical protein [Candidatus Lokiarchaeota archaeon]
MRRKYRCKGCSHSPAACEFDFDRMVAITDKKNVFEIQKLEDNSWIEQPYESEESEWQSSGDCGYHHEEAYEKYLKDKEMDDAIEEMLKKDTI